jgi:hypothetical protein
MPADTEDLGHIAADMAVLGHMRVDMGRIPSAVMEDLDHIPVDMEDSGHIPADIAVLGHMPAAMGHISVDIADLGHTGAAMGIIAVGRISVAAEVSRIITTIIMITTIITNTMFTNLGNCTIVTVATNTNEILICYHNLVVIILCSCS